MYETTKLNIREAASMLEVNPETLRRWDKSKKLIARRDSPTAHRYYFEDDIVEFLRDNYKYLYKLAMRWAFSQKPLRLPEALYCQDSFIFKGRLSKLEDFLSKDKSQENRFPLVTSVIGEIGNNSFDHNIGNWPDVPGIFFGWSLRKRKIILIDRGLGILSTLKRVKPELKSDREALKIAFTKSLINGSFNFISSNQYCPYSEFIHL